LKNPYRVLGITLAVPGALLAPLFYFLLSSVPLAATALSAIILGVTCIALANARPYISPEASQTLLKTGMENTAALLEELGLQNTAIYLPSHLRDGHPQALVPLSKDGGLRNMREKLPGRLIVRYGPDNADVAIAVTTAGSVNLELLSRKPGPTVEDIESALNYLLTGVMDIASGVTVHLADSTITVNVAGAKLTYENTWYNRCLGSPLASVAAAVASEALARPVRIIEEVSSHGKTRISLELLS